MCQICIPIAYLQLCLFKVIKLNVQMRPVFADLHAWSHLTYNVHSYGIVARIHCMHACACSVFIVVDDSAFVSDDELAVLTKKDFLQNDELY